MVIARAAVCADDCAGDRRAAHRWLPDDRTWHLRGLGRRARNCARRTRLSSARAFQHRAISRRGDGIRIAVRDGAARDVSHHRSGCWRRDTDRTGDGASADGRAREHAPLHRADGEGNGGSIPFAGAAFVRRVRDSRSDGHHPLCESGRRARVRHIGGPDGESHAGGAGTRSRSRRVRGALFGVTDGEFVDQSHRLPDDSHRWRMDAHGNRRHEPAR